MRKLKLKNKKRFTMFLCILVASIIIIPVTILSNNRLIESITVEAGSPMPPAAEFLKNTGREASYVTDISKIPFNVPGTYEIEIKSGRRNFKSELQIVDTTPPKGTVRKLDFVDAESLKPESFFSTIEDAADVVVTYKETPDFAKINSQPVTLILTDSSGNKTEYETSLRISKVLEALKVEAGSEKLYTTEFLKPGVKADNITLKGDSFSLGRVGTFPVQLDIDGIIYDSAVEVVDTVPPAAVAVDQSGWTGSRVEAESFISEINDKTPVSVAYQKEPDFKTAGEQSVTLVLTDEGGNQTILQSKLTLQEDTIPPNIFGAKKATAYIGQPISYKKGVYAEDNKDGEVAVTVDSSKVNLKVEGEYPVYYSAVDSSGNKANVEVTVTVKPQSVTEAELQKLADEVLSEITTEDMTVLEKAWAIYKYVNTHVTYTGVSDKTDWMKEAYSGITRGVGDCFTYYSMSQLLLNRTGIQTLSVERASVGDEAHHYWHMVNFGEGWYHFDACIHKPKLVSFMLTTAELDAFSRKAGGDNYYYRYDRENYPVSEEEPSEEILALRAKN